MSAPNSPISRMSAPNSPVSRLSPSYKNLRNRNHNSPIELKERIRKSYKEKVQNARHSIYNNLRRVNTEQGLHSTLSDIYRGLFDVSEITTSDEEEVKLMKEIQEELVKEELEWWIEEYERCQNENIDCYTMNFEDNVICPVCMKTNFVVNSQIISCPCCDIKIHTNKQLGEVKDIIHACVESHSNTCDADIQFTTISHSSEDTHIYLICGTCTEIKEII